MSTGAVDIHEVKRSQRHLWPLLKTTEAPIWIICCQNKTKIMRDKMLRELL